MNNKHDLNELLNTKKSIASKKSSIDQISHFVNKALQVCSGNAFSDVKQHLIAALNLLNKVDGKMNSKANVTQSLIEKAKGNNANWNKMLVDGLAKKLLEMPKEEDKEDGTEV